MKIEIDTHTHTLASGHAYNTIWEMAKEAAERGFKGLAITDHAPAMPGGPHAYYFQNLRVIPRKKYGIELLLGVELNIRNESGEIDMKEATLKEMDIRIASLHDSCYEGEKEKEKITRAYVNAMENPYVDIIGHPDDDRVPVDLEELVLAAKRTGALLEVNNSSLRPTAFRVGARKNIKRLMELCKENNVMIVLGTDSHVDADIGDYTYTEEVLKETDFPEELIANTSLEKLKSLLKYRTLLDEVHPPR